MSREKVQSVDTDWGSRRIASADIGGRIRRFRQELRLSQAELAARLGVAKTTVFNAERGQQDFNWKLLFWLVVKYGVDPLWLLFGEEVSKSMFRDDRQLIGHMVKRRPESLREFRNPKVGGEWILFPTEPEEGLIRFLKRVETLFLSGSAEQRETLDRLIGVVEDLRSPKPAIAPKTRAMS